MSESTRHTYRPELDGIRAIAILSVLGFHVGFSDWSGGFLGVDVFFVLSGWLICGHIHDSLLRGDFSPASFFARRIRRLLPAAFACYLAVSIAVYFVFLPSEAVTFPQYLIGSSFFFNNVILAQEAGYFAPSSTLNPLLHTWSLSIEEQFYLVVPWLALLFSRNPKGFPMILAIAFVLSLSLVLFSGQRIVTDEARYYSSVFRVWEIAAGGLAYVVTRNRSLPRLPGITLLAVIAVIAPIFILDETFPHPGPWALLTVAGTLGLILFAAPQSTVTGKVLGSRVMSFLGRISYSTYLWHWPLISFYHYVRGEIYDDEIRLLIVALSFGLGYLSYRFIEAPVRNMRVPERNRTLFAGFAIQAFIIVAVAGGMWSSNRGDGGEVASSIAAILDEGEIGNPHWGECWFNQARPESCGFGNEAGAARPVVLWGDSMASSAYLAFHELAQARNADGTAFVLPGCAPMQGVAYPFGTIEECFSMNAFVVSWLAEQPPTDIYLFARWPMYFLGYPNTDLTAEGSIAFVRQDGTPIEEPTQQMFAAGLRGTLEAIPDHHRVTIIGPVPESQVPVPQAMIREIRFGHEVPELSRSVFERRSEETRESLRTAAQDLGAGFLDLIDVFCGPDSCPFHNNGSPVLADSVHLTPTGNTMLREAIELVADRGSEE